METKFTDQDKKWIQNTIREKYSKAAKGPEGLFDYPTGHEGLTRLKYNPELLQALPLAKRGGPYGKGIFGSASKSRLCEC